ncbi:hypothetical protein GWK47_012253 [Chionoecetes opilio]|uniref:Uncharacterized protein n=1 Tax=Chionoecetes opilio TaxID=41210 RepID=A0A8J5CM34_CHIOP|nr:hypothetical protein GWK47_012253 [Chionoecetes opilio]
MLTSRKPARHGGRPTARHPTTTSAPVMDPTDPTTPTFTCTCLSPLPGPSHLQAHSPMPCLPACKAISQLGPEDPVVEPTASPVYCTPLTALRYVSYHPWSFWYSHCPCTYVLVGDNKGAVMMRMMTTLYFLLLLPPPLLLIEEDGATVLTRLLTLQR